MSALPSRPIFIAAKRERTSAFESDVPSQPYGSHASTRWVSERRRYVRGLARWRSVSDREPANSEPRKLGPRVPVSPQEFPISMLWTVCWAETGWQYAETGSHEPQRGTQHSFSRRRHTTPDEGDGLSAVKKKWTEEVTSQSPGPGIRTTIARGRSWRFGGCPMPSCRSCEQITKRWRALV